MKYKCSKYNVYGEKGVVSNTMTGANIVLEAQEFKMLHNNEFAFFSPDQIEVLLENGFIVDNRIDEVQLLRNAYNICRYQSKIASFTIAPTLSCNFDCVYCYENKTNVHMSIDTMNLLINYIKSLVSENGLQGVSINWYGGEPLICKNLISYFSDNIIDFCDRSGIDYSASMITNGYLITEQDIAFFRKYRIDNIQITIDGPREIHNQRRFLIGGEGTFDTICANVMLLAKNEIHVNLRTNIDKTNINCYKSVQSIFSGNSFIHCYPAVVTIEETQTESFCATCFKQNEYGALYKSLLSEMSKEERKCVYDRCNPSICTCTADRPFSFVVSPQGDLFKCLNDVDDPNAAVDSLTRDVNGAFSISKYMGRDVFTEEECKDCKYLPICYGGCVFEYEKHGKHSCLMGKYIFDDYQKEVVEQE